MDDRGGLRDLRRLKVIGVAAPVAFLAGCELVRLAILEPALGSGLANLIVVVTAAVAAAAFGIVIFLNIERAQQHVVRQNRDMGIITAVSVAIQGELDIDQVLGAALRVVLDATGARRATVTVHASELDDDLAREVRLAAPDGDIVDALTSPDRIVEIGLPSGPASIGRLRLEVPAGRVAALPSIEALHTVGHQLAAAIQIGQLVADLQRRKHEGHTLYQALLAISNQAPLAEILVSIADGARDRLGADDRCICLTEPVARAFAGDGPVTGDLAASAGCGQPHGGPGADGQARVHRCTIGTASDYAAVLHVPIWSPGELLGDLWIGRRSGESFTERDRRYLMTLAGLAAIAIAAARLREQEQQGAVLAERDRIARELHDSLAQVLGSTHLRLRGLLARSEVAANARIASELAELADVSEEAYRDVREAILGLREASRTRGLLEGLRAFLEKYTMQSGVRAELETDLVDEPALTSSAEIQVIRVIQEALANVRKHARARTAQVRVTSVRPDGKLMIVIEDDGRGFDPGRVGVHRDGGFGLQTMRERMELVGGSLRIDAALGRGTRIVAVVPEAPRVRGAGPVEEPR